MPRAKRKKPYNPPRFTTGDRRTCRATRKWRRSRSTIRWALEPGEKIVTLRSIRNDPLGRLHSHHQIDEAQYQGGRAFQDDWEKAERGPQAVDPGREYVDGGQYRASRSPSASARRCCGSTASSANSAPTASALVHEVLMLGHDHGADRPAARLSAASAGWIISRGDFANASTGWR